jgi:teichoic acid transport system ATP-binding protein
VDEALSVGDVFFQNKCYRKFEEFKAQGKTILFVSHDLSSIAKYCDRAILLNKGKKMAEGTPKDMIDLYKKILVNQVDDEGNDISQMSMLSAAEKTNSVKTDNSGEKIALAKEVDQWNKNYTINPQVNSYGDGTAEIIDFAVIDHNGLITEAIEKGTRFEIRSKVKFNKTVQDPIFTYTFKNIQGTAITGTNTMYEKESIGTVEPGDICVAHFEQEMNLQGGEYLLSISCTGYAEGDFRVYHRLYDVINITVVSDKNTVGFYDMNSKTSIEKL